MAIPGEVRPPSPSSQAIAALVVSLLGVLICCGLLSPIGWFLGAQERKAIREGRSPVSGEALAQIAVVLGIFGTVMLVILLLWALFFGGLLVIAGWLGR
jgi:hypothetical protein